MPFQYRRRASAVKPEDLHRSENVAFDAVSCTTVPISREGGPAKWLKIQNLENHLCDFEPEGRELESLRARHLSKVYSGHIGNRLFRLLIVAKARYDCNGVVSGQELSFRANSLN